jgi:hypothetical protein
MVSAQRLKPRGGALDRSTRKVGAEPLWSASRGQHAAHHSSVGANLRMRARATTWTGSPTGRPHVDGLSAVRSMADMRSVERACGERSERGPPLPATSECAMRERASSVAGSGLSPTSRGL